MTLQENPGHPGDDDLQQALARRLRKLGGMPVDTTRLDRALRAALPPPPRRKTRWSAQIAAAAASLILIATIAFFTLQGRPVQASAALMAQMHQDIVSGKIPTMKADTIQQANDAIAAMAGNSIRLPESPNTHTMACCMRSIGNKQVACVLLKNQGVPVTLSAAKASDVTPPQGPLTLYRGVNYHVQTIGNLHMVSFQNGDLWICLIGQTPAQTLLDLADQLHQAPSTR